MIDSELVHAMQERLMQPDLWANSDGEWCELRGIMESALELVRSDCSAAHDGDSPAAAVDAFQLAVELREPDPASPISRREVERMVEARDRRALSDTAWCRRFGVDPSALIRIRETYGLNPDPRVSSVNAFQLAVEARRVGAGEVGAA